MKLYNVKYCSVVQHCDDEGRILAETTYAQQHDFFVVAELAIDAIDIFDSTIRRQTRKNGEVVSHTISEVVIAANTIHNVDAVFKQAHREA